MRPKVEGPVRWKTGEPGLVAEIDRCLEDGLGRKTRLHHTPRRSVYKLGLAGDDTSGPRGIALKIHHRRPGKHTLRDGLKRALGQSSARREWQSLGRLQSIGVPVPGPLAWGRLPNGDEVVVCTFIEGIPLLDCLPTADEAMQGALLESLGETLSTLYSADFRHGDLHVGNLMVLPKKEREEIVLLDVGSASRSRRESTRRTDLARLELSLLRAGFCAPARATLRKQLDVGPTFPKAYARFLKDHLRGRARRVFALGRRTAEARHGKAHGLRASRFSGTALTEAMSRAEHLPGEVRRGGRVRLVEIETEAGHLIVKESHAGSWRRALADRFRGSPAARAFHRGRRQGLLAERTAPPLAFLEERSFGVPKRSWLILEYVGEQDLDALRLPPGESQENLGRSFGEWLAEGHSLGLSHRDAKANNIRVVRDRDAWHFAWVDLEDLEGPRDLPRSDRIRTWSQICASLPDAFFSLETRRAALSAYTTQMAYADGEQERDPAVAKNRHEALVREIAQASLARQHRWRGEGCDCAQADRAGQAGQAEAND
ncbi:MAG: lipopolysaccharide kinase InaA family protein [Myxococcota bacterium]